MVSLEGGQPGASSKMDKSGEYFDGSQAFQRQKFESRTGYRTYPWISSESASLPQSVWIRLPSTVKVTAFSFRSRAEKVDEYSQNWINRFGHDHFLNFSPTKFDLIGSDDCVDWTVISQVDDVNWTTRDGENYWQVPSYERKPVKCLGITVRAIGGGNQTAIQDLKFWEDVPRKRSIPEKPMQRLVDYVKRKHKQLELDIKNSRREFNNKLRNAQISLETGPYKPTTPVNDLKPTPGFPAGSDIRWREDGRCGSNYPASNGEPAECNPDGKYFCCSPRDWCGQTAQHCDCGSCVNYKEKKFVEEAMIQNPDFNQCCLTPKCTNYRGILNVTKSGKTCQAWDSDTYHERQTVLKNQEKRNESGLDENYCRNPTNNKKGVWCYTNDPHTRWESCEVSFCELD